MKSMEFFIIRHGQTEFNRSGKIQGSLDSDLTEQGAEDARNLGEFLKRSEVRFDRWITSPQPRAMKTSALILEAMGDFSIGQQMDDRIREIHCGDLEGKKLTEIDELTMHRLRTDPSYPYPGGGESVNELIGRADLFLSELEKSYATYSISPAGQDGVYRIGIVSHGNMNRCMAARLLGADGHFALKIMQNNTGFSRFRSSVAGEGIYRMVSWNETPHLLRE